MPTVYYADTMLSRKKKILIIIHLIFAFTYLSWLFMKPYAMQIVTRKSEKSLYEMVMAREALFQKLSTQEQLAIKQGRELRQTPSLSHQLHRLFFVETPPFALAWIFFSLLISLFLLLGIEGATKTAWILPLLALGYGYFLYSTPPKQREGLFPEESYVRTYYLTTEKGKNDRQQLMKAWHRYVITEWALENPEEDPPLFEEQLERGLFAFNIARLKWIQEGKGDEVVTAGFSTPPSQFRIFAYLLWNLIFAWLVTRKQRPSTLQSTLS